MPPSPSAPDLTVREVMRPAVTTVERTAHVAAAAYLMKRSHDNALVVLADSSSRVPVTLVCDGDVTQAVADGRDLEQIRLVDLDLPVMVGLSPDTPVPEAAERMLQAAVAYAPVVEDGALVGLVDLAALTRGLLIGRRQDRLADARP
ncbi:CBS domain-containing protein [Blastococcus aggregatus]|uniref:CBS domain-containing protein n=1 Tax=Blastococcus aggregatus TaxID=38502 RepID=A0A285V945_9ACTN|nr:CBS domain-containing protein [Blastococcus aggregatus]SOC50590.1 CBS domain-containing protein [Blastococcus aggregatus]